MNQSIYTERENILPHHAEWLDGCGATWAYGDVSFAKYKQITDLTIFNGWFSKQFSETVKIYISDTYTHIPTGTEFCERVAEILGLPKPTFEADKFIESEQAIIDRAKDNPMQPFVDEMTKKGTATDHIPDVGQKVDISKTETTTDHIPYVGEKVDEQDKLFPGRNNTMGEGSLTQEDIEILLGDSIVKSIKGMAIEVSRLGQADREWVVEVRNKLCNWHMWKYCIYKEGRIKLGDVLDKDLTITESPTEFLEYVGKQTGKEYKPGIASEKEIAGMLEKMDGDIDDGPSFEDIANALGGQPVSEPYKFKSYRILDSLDGIPLDKRIPLSEWIPPFGVDVNFIHNGDFDRGNVHCIAKEGIIVKWRSLDCVFDPDGHWMRIV